VGQGFLALDLDACPDLPGLTEVIAVEGAQGADGLIEGGASELAFTLEMKEEIEDFARAKVGELCAGVVIGELGDPTEVGSDGSPAQAFEVDETGVILIPLCGGEAPTN
jgi:hypothetical protein